MTQLGTTGGLGLTGPAAAAADVSLPGRLTQVVEQIGARVPRGEPLPPDLWRRRHLLPVRLLGLFAVGIPIVAIWFGHPASGLVRGVVAGLLALLTWRLVEPRWLAEAATTFALYLASSMLSQQMDGLLEARVTFFLAALVAIAAYEGWTPLVVALFYVPLDSAARLAFGFIRSNGGEVPVEYSVVPLGTPERPGGAVVTFRDVTARLEAAARERELSRLHEADVIHRRLLEQMQDALLPPLPAADRLEIGVRYLSADPSAPTGGDLYDVQMVGPNELLVTVVDALGKGVGATKDALAVVHLVRSLVLEGHDLALAINKAAGIVEQHSPELVATVTCARINARSGITRLVSGGHPPALVVRDGSATYLEAVGGPLGWPGAGADGAVDAELGDGDAIVFFTDGLVEAGHDIVAGLDQLAREAASLWGLPAQEMADELMERLAAAPERRDDTLVLVVRRRPSP